MKIYKVVNLSARAWGASDSILAAESPARAEEIYLEGYPDYTVEAVELGTANDDVEEGFILDGYWE